MTAVGLQSRAPLDVAKVIQQTIEVYRRNLIPFLLTGLLMAGLPQLVVGLVQLNQASLAGVGRTPPANLALWGLLAAVAGMAAAVIGLLFQAAINRATVEQLDGQTGSWARNRRLVYPSGCSPRPVAVPGRWTGPLARRASSG